MVKFVWCAHLHLARLYGWDCWVALQTYELILCLRCQLWLVLWKKGERDMDRKLTSFFFHIWFVVCLWGSQLWSDVLCWQLWMLDEQWATKCWCWNEKLWCLNLSEKKSTDREKRLKIPPVYSFRGIRAYDELQTFATEVGQVKQVDIWVLRNVTLCRWKSRFSCSKKRVAFNITAKESKTTTLLLSRFRTSDYVVPF